MDKNFLNWLAGFIDGEGSFSVNKIRSRGHKYYVPTLVVKLREDDADILYEISKITKVGAVYFPQSQKNQAKWQVSNIPQCEKIISILDKHPLRAKKKVDYLKWREIVFHIKKNGTRENVFVDKLIKEMSESRKYKWL